MQLWFRYIWYNPWISFSPSRPVVQSLLTRSAPPLLIRAFHSESAVISLLHVLPLISPFYRSSPSSSLETCSQKCVPLKALISFLKHYFLSVRRIGSTGAFSLFDGSSLVHFCSLSRPTLKCTRTRTLQCIRYGVFRSLTKTPVFWVLRPSVARLR